MSVAQPTLTLAGHIEQRFARLPWDDAEKVKANSLGNDGILSLVRASKHYNPDRKQLTVEQSHALQAMIDEFARRDREMLLEMQTSYRDFFQRL